MSNIYIVRHGQTTWNIEKRIQGHANAELTEKGRRQGDLVAERLKDENIDIIYSSDLDRARITAEKIGKLSGTRVIVDRELRDMSFGIWEGMLFSDVKKKIVTSSLVRVSSTSVILQDSTRIRDNHYRALRSRAPTIDTRQRKLIPILRSNLDFYLRGDSDLGGRGACLC